MVKSARLLLVAALLAVLGACSSVKTGAGGHADGRAAGTAAVADDGPVNSSASAARRPQLLKTAQLRQKAPPRDGA